jgi:inositol phosphorylceramide synthase catalytic subunit
MRTDCVSSLQDLPQSNGWRYAIAALVAGHLLLIAGTTELNLRHLVLDAVLLALTATASSRLVLELALPIWLFAVAYFDVLPPALLLRGDIHVSDLYGAELRWFGSLGPSGRQIPGEVFRDRHWAWVDLVCGLVYMAELVEPLLFVIWLYAFDRQRLPRVVWAFLLLNLCGFATWVLFPAAPPWYVAAYGLGPAVLDARSSAAGLLRLDDVLGIGLVQGYYAQSVNVFGAMPSVHVAVPTMVACATLGMGLRWFLPALLFLAAMTFGAVYFQHHYVLDVSAGLTYGVLSYALVAAFAAIRRARCSPSEPGTAVD